jgi:hypothetical protein
MSSLRAWIVSRSRLRRSLRRSSSNILSGSAAGSAGSAGSATVFATLLCSRKINKVFRKTIVLANLPATIVTIVWPLSFGQWCLSGIVYAVVAAVAVAVVAAARLSWSWSSSFLFL